jgi:hypothetical protein
MSVGGFWIAMNGWNTLAVALERPHKSRSLMSPPGWWGIAPSSLAGNNVTGGNIVIGDERSSLSIRFTQVWARRDGRWLREAFQATLVDPVKVGNPSSGHRRQCDAANLDPLEKARPGDEEKDR